MPRVAAESRRLAINLFDLDRIDEFVRQSLLAGVIDKSAAVWMDKARVDESGVVFTCDLLRAAAICDIIRNHDRRLSNYPTRVYVYRRAWTKLSSTTVLTLHDESGTLSLNPEIFAVEVGHEDHVDLQPERVF